jgi:lipid A 3-O-deacylase
VSLAACARPCGGQRLARAIRVGIDNDYFVFSRPPRKRPDDNYTQGARVGWDSERAPSLVRRLACSTRVACTFAYEIGQEIYTPTFDSVDRLAGERPYAGWLYVQSSAISATRRSRRTLTATLGVTGSASLAEQTQAAFHRLVPGFRRPLGWDRQLPTEPDLAVRGTVEWHLPAPRSVGRWADLVPMASGVVGTLRSAVGSGVQARAGVGLSHPWLVDSRAGRWEAYAFAGARGDLVGRDLFLDGDTFRRSERVDREPFVGSWEWGVTLRARRVGLEYRAVHVGREYPTGPASHPFGSIRLTYWTLR